jgi:hypothetical protein
MNARFAQWLTCLYPRAWRVRYGEEFKAFLEAEPLTPRAVLNVIGCALYGRLCSLGEFKMSKLQRSLVLVVYAYLAAIAAGVNLYMTVDDTPLVDTMSAHGALSAWWNLVAAGSLAALAAVLALGLPALWAMLRFAWTARRRDIVARLAFPPCAVALILIWIIAVAMRTGWAPLFWDVMGGGVARWALSSVTLILVVLGLLGSAISLKQAIQRSALSEQQLTLFGRVLSIRPLQLAKIPTLILAGSIVMMAAGVAGWGLLADQYAPSAFHARDGGFFGTPNIVSWMGSLLLFIVSAVTVLRGARWAMKSHAE